MAEGRDEASPHRVFLCYRRESAAALAGRLKDRLDGRFTAVFLDATGIPPGSDWPETIALELHRSTVLLAVIDSGWLAGQQRLRSDTDVVRREITTALRAGIWVIPPRAASSPSGTSPRPAAVRTGSPYLSSMSRFRPG